MSSKVKSLMALYQQKNTCHEEYYLCEKFHENVRLLCCVAKLKFGLLLSQHCCMSVSVYTFLCIGRNQVKGKPGNNVFEKPIIEGFRGVGRGFQGAQNPSL